MSEVWLFKALVGILLQDAPIARWRRKFNETRGICFPEGT